MNFASKLMKFVFKVMNFELNRRANASDDVGFISDGDVFYYRDNTEELKELTEEEKKTLKKIYKAKQAASSGEVGVKIKIAKGPTAAATDAAAGGTKETAAPSLGD